MKSNVQMVGSAKGGAQAGRRGMDLAIGVCLSLLATAALAQTGDPMGNGICQLVLMFTGKVAFGLSVLGLMGVFIPYLFGIELNEFMKKMSSFVIVVCAIFGGTALLRMLLQSFGVNATC